MIISGGTPAPLVAKADILPFNVKAVSGSYSFAANPTAVGVWVNVMEMTGRWAIYRLAINSTKYGTDSASDSGDYKVIIDGDLKYQASMHLNAETNLVHNRTSGFSFDSRPALLVENSLKVIGTGNRKRFLSVTAYGLPL